MSSQSLNVKQMVNNIVIMNPIYNPGIPPYRMMQGPRRCQASSEVIKFVV